MGSGSGAEATCGVIVHEDNVKALMWMGRSLKLGLLNDRVGHVRP